MAALPTAAVRVGQPKMVDDADVRGGVSQVAFCQIFIRRRFYRLRCWLPTSACVCFIPLPFLLLLLRLRLHDFYLMNFANFLMQHLTHAKDARTVDFCCCYCLFCFFFAKFFSPTCLRIHDVQIIVSILKIPSDLCVLQSSDCVCVCVCAE